MDARPTARSPSIARIRRTPRVRTENVSDQVLPHRCLARCVGSVVVFAHVAKQVDHGFEVLGFIVNDAHGIEGG